MPVAQQPQLSSSLVQKGRAAPADPVDALGPELLERGTIAPAITRASEPERGQGGMPTVAERPSLGTDEPPLQPAPVDDVLRRLISFRTPVQLDQDLRAMVFETGRTKQDLLTDFLAEGIRKWRVARRRAAG
jgi:hypothetical protein